MADAPAPWLRRLWERMTSAYGHSWTSVHGTSPQNLDTGVLTVDGDTWSRALAGLTAQQLGVGLDACIRDAADFPPSVGRFRAMCLSIPTVAHIQREFREGIRDRRAKADWSPFSRLVWGNLDSWAYSHAEIKAAERILRDAYEAARDHVMAGGALPEPVLAIESKPKPEKSPEEKAAAREAGLKAMRELREELGLDAA